MKKLMYSLVALAALSSGSVWANAECQAGSAWGPNPACNDPGAVPITGYYGWTPSTPTANQVYVYPPLAQAFPQQVYPQQYPNGYGVWVDPATGAQYTVRPRANDRDGDGVRNNRDRYPDDPRYH